MGFGKVAWRLCRIQCGYVEEAAVIWSPWQESNLHLALRRHLFYPLNYREMDMSDGGRTSRLTASS